MGAQDSRPDLDRVPESGGAVTGEGKRYRLYLIAKEYDEAGNVTDPIAEAHTIWPSIPMLTYKELQAVTEALMTNIRSVSPADFCPPEEGDAD